MGNAWPAREGPPRLTFGDFEIEVDLVRARRNGQPVALRPKTFALLVHLADRAGTVVSKQELMAAIWPGLVVTDDSLTQAISELRGALDDRDQKLIKTIPKRGYLFDTAVRPAPAGQRPPRPQRRRGGRAGASLRWPPGRCWRWPQASGLLSDAARDRRADRPGPGREPLAGGHALHRSERTACAASGAGRGHRPEHRPERGWPTSA